MEKFERVLALMVAKPDGKVAVNDPELIAILGDKLAGYRLPMYMTAIRKRGGFDVKGIREGRKVVAYQLVAREKPADALEYPETPVPVVTFIEGPEPGDEGYVGELFDPNGQTFIDPDAVIPADLGNGAAISIYPDSLDEFAGEEPPPAVPAPPVVPLSVILADDIAPPAGSPTPSPEPPSDDPGDTPPSDDGWSI